MPQVLTTSGYKEAADCVIGEELIAFNEAGESETNTLQDVKWITRESYLSSNPHIEGLTFDFYKINNGSEFFQDQTIYANGRGIHVSGLKVGDEIYDDHDAPITVESIEKIEDRDGWYRFIVSGDHSYIADGFSLHNASRFWRGGGSSTSWAATANTNWGLTTLAANNQTVPGISDIAIFDSNSPSPNVIGAAITVTGVECDGSSLGTGAYTGTMTHNAFTLTLNTGQANTMRFSAGMTYTPATTSALVTLTHTSGTANIVCNGKKLFALTINGAGGTTQTLDPLLVNFGTSAALTVTSGILDANGGAGGPYAITANLLVCSGAVTRSLILGGTVTIGGAVVAGATIWSTTGTNLTFTKNSANIVVLAPASAIEGVVFAVGALGSTFNTVTLNATSNNTIFSMLGGTAPTFATLNIGAGWNFYFTTNVTTTITNAFTWAGTAANPIALIGCVGSISQVATISVGSGACTLNWGVVQGVTGAGGATFTATNTLNLGTNSNWSISPPADATTVAPTAAQIATAVWQDTTAGDFTVSGSVGADLKTGAVPGAANGHFIAGTNAATTITTSLTTTFTGNLTGSVASVTGNVAGSVASVTGNVAGSVASVTGNVGGNVTGSVGSVAGAVGSVTARVTANSDQIAGSAPASTDLAATANAIPRGTATTGASTTSVPTSALTIAGSAASGVVADQFKGRVILFDGNTTTAGLRGAAATISASTASNTPTFTVTALPATPASGDTFSVI